MLVQSVFDFFLLKWNINILHVLYCAFPSAFFKIPDVFTIYNIPFSFEKFRYGK